MATSDSHLCSIATLLSMIRKTLQLSDSRYDAETHLTMTVHLQDIIPTTLRHYGSGFFSIILAGQVQLLPFSPYSWSDAVARSPAKTVRLLDSPDFTPCREGTEAAPAHTRDRAATEMPATMIPRMRDQDPVKGRARTDSEAPIKTRIRPKVKSFRGLGIRSKAKLKTPLLQYSFSPLNTRAITTLRR